MTDKPTPEQIAKLPKWAQEYLKDVRKGAAMQAALRFTQDVERDLPPPQNFSGLSKGWNYNASLSYFRVEKACSSSVGHGDGWERTCSQCPLSLFTTKLKALMAMRRELEQECAKILAKVDLQIEEEKRNPTQ